MAIDACTRLKEVKTADLIGLLGARPLVIVDIRDGPERQCSGCIPGSFHTPRYMIEFWAKP